MKKYILLSMCYIYFVPVLHAQVIIDNIEIQYLGHNKIRITNIGNQPITNIKINDKQLTTDFYLKPNDYKEFQFSEKNKKAVIKQKLTEQEKKALIDLLGVSPNDL